MEVKEWTYEEIKKEIRLILQTSELNRDLELRLLEFASGLYFAGRRFQIKKFKNFLRGTNKKNVNR